MSSSARPEALPSGAAPEDKITELSTRLAEAEETLQAIRNGLVDAVVISGSNGDQVFTLRGADQPYRMILQTMHEGAMTLTRSGTVLFSNHRLSEMLDAPLERIVGASFAQFVAEEDREDFTVFVAQTAGSSARREYRLQTGTGSTLPVMMSACPLVSDGLQLISAVVMDLTERKQAETALKAAHDSLERRVEERTAELTAANQQLATEIAERIPVEEALRESQEHLKRYGEELERLVAERTAQVQRLEQQRLESEKQVAMGRMAARVAHEINNPLAGVKNSFILIKRAIPANHPHYEFVGLIDREIERIARIVKQMYQLYKPEHRDASVVKAAAVMQDITALLEGNCRAHGVTLELDTHAAGGPVRIHEDSLRQVLFNVVQNAIEASPPNGRVRLSASLTNGHLAIAVADEGPGIPPELGARIYEPFFTSKQTMANGGLGLGLSITKGLVEALGGSIGYISAPGEGTVFQITLPLETANQLDPV